MKKGTPGGTASGVARRAATSARDADILSAYRQLTGTGSTKAQALAGIKFLSSIGARPNLRPGASPYRHISEALSKVGQPLTTMSVYRIIMRLATL